MALKVQVVAMVTQVIAIVAMDEDVETPTISSVPISVHREATPTTVGLSVRYASKRDILLLTVDIVLMRIMYRMSAWLLRPPTHTQLTPTGIQIRELLVM